MDPIVYWIASSFKGEGLRIPADVKRKHCATKHKTQTKTIGLTITNSECVCVCVCGGIKKKSRDFSWLKIKTKHESECKRWKQCVINTPRTKMAVGAPIKTKSRYDGGTHGWWMVQAKRIRSVWKQPGGGHASAMFGILFRYSC